MSFTTDLLVNVSGFVSLACVVAFAIVDRCIFSRGKAEIKNAVQYAAKNNKLRFALSYFLSSVPNWSEIKYQLIDMKDPSTIVSGVSRGLDFSKKGLNSEFLLFNQCDVPSGEWRLKVKITTSADRFNPLYVIFPIVSYFETTVLIK